MHFLYYFLLHFLCAFFITPTVFTWLRKIPQKLTSRRYFRPVALFVEPLPALGGFETLGGVDDATKCRRAVIGETHISPDIRRQLEETPSVPKISRRQTKVLSAVAREIKQGNRRADWHPRRQRGRYRQYAIHKARRPYPR